MVNWIDKYKKWVISSHKQHIMVADQDDLFEYAELKQAFVNEGYTILRAKTELSVRIQFELQVRNSPVKYLVVVPASYTPLPDIEQHVHFQSVGLPLLFPKLDAKAIKGLSFNGLCVLSNIKPYEELSHDKTLKFLLENLYNVDFDVLTNSRARERILTMLIAVLLEKDGINEPLTKFLTDLTKPYYPTLLDNGLTSHSLLQFLQQQWRSYVEDKGSLLEFKEPLLNKSLGYLFAMGYLDPVKIAPDQWTDFPKPLRIGVCIDEQGHNDHELEGLIEYLRQQLEIIEDIAGQWFKIIQVFANAKLKYLASADGALQENYRKIEQAFNIRFQRFIDSAYGSLFSLSGVRTPVVVSRILEHINASPASKKALLVIDGMNYWQSNILHKALSDAGINGASGATLAFIPTITAWSRQSIFKGDKPDLKENNAKEGNLFREFWQKKGVPAHQIDFKRIGLEAPFSVTDMAKEVTILGLVCNDLDDIMHGSVLGDEQLKTSTGQWIVKSGIVQLITDLKAAGFQVFITADHGNVEARGLKNLTLKEKVGALSRGKRHLHFTNETLLEDFLQQNADLALGRRGLSVYMKQNEAFTTGNSQVITHGGSHFWEVIVPFTNINE